MTDAKNVIVYEIDQNIVPGFIFSQILEIEDTRFELFRGLKVSRITIRFSDEFEDTFMISKDINLSDPNSRIETYILNFNADKEEELLKRINQFLVKPENQHYKDTKVFKKFNYHNTYHNSKGLYICNPIDEIEKQYGIKIPLNKEEAEKMGLKAA